MVDKMMMMMTDVDDDNISKMSMTTDYKDKICN